MQRPDKQGNDYGNNNPWSTVKSKKKSRNKPNLGTPRGTQQQTPRGSQQRTPRGSQQRTHRGSQQRTPRGSHIYSQQGIPQYNQHQSNRRYDNGPNRFSRFQEQEEVKKPKYEHKPKPVYVPTGPNYASVTKDDDPNVEQKSGIIAPTIPLPEEQKSGIIAPTIPLPNRQRWTTRNQVPRPNNKNSFNAWEFVYFKHILDLSDIFSKGISELDFDAKSFNFLDIFSHFIRDASSGEISRYIEELDEKTDQFYLEYTIKRNNF
jgi:hypothetical protein